MVSSDYKSVPVLIIGYSRVNSIRDIFNNLVKFGVTDIFLALDFAHDPVLLNEQRDLVHELKEKAINSETNLRVWHRNRNHGVALGVLSGLDWFFSENETGIVIEDDLFFDVNFLKFCASSLDYYRDNGDVLMVSGNRYDGRSLETKVAITNYPQIWGWATWRSKWQEIRDLIVRKTRINYSQITRSEVGYFYAGAVRARIGLVDTWDTPLAYEMLVRGKFCLLPPVNLVSNVGSDNHAVHTQESSFPMNHPIEKVLDITFPSMESLIAESKLHNIYLEKNVFQVRMKHILSPIKLRFGILYGKIQGKKTTSLKSRLSRVEKFDTQF